jgi:hypothetical protein
MADKSLTDYYNNLIVESISGVTSFTSIPTQLNTAQLPCKYVRWTNLQNAVSSLSQLNGLPSYTFEVVVLIEPVGQNTTVANQSLSMQIAEHMLSYAENLDGFLSINCAFEINLINNVAYWGLISTIEILGD